jgi:hypothetical protein
MVFPASSATTFTNNNIALTASNDVQLEINGVEEQIRFATGIGAFEILYNASTIGNPKGPPQVESNLTPNQETFYTLLINAGYVVTFDSGTGRWKVSWAVAGPEALVNVYSFRTTLAPGGIFTNTINAIEVFFAGLTPVVHSVAVTNGDIDETTFGASADTFYEYTIVVDQEFNTTDYSSALKTYVVSQGLGYLTGNCNVFKMI